MIRPPPESTRTDTRFPSTTLFRSRIEVQYIRCVEGRMALQSFPVGPDQDALDPVLPSIGKSIPLVRDHMARSDTPAVVLSHDVVLDPLAVVANLADPRIVRERGIIIVSSAERRVGKVCFSTCRSRCPPNH